MKRISTIVLLMILCLSFGTCSFAMDEEPYRQKIPRIIFVEDAEIPRVSAGEELKLLINYKNDSIHTASKLRFTPVLEDTPIVYERPIVFERQTTLRGGKEDTVSFNFQISETAKIGTYPLKFKLEYCNTRDENYTSEATVYFKVDKEKTKPIVEIENINMGEHSIYAGGRFNLSFDIANNGEINANNLEVSITDQNENKFMVVGADDYRYIGTLKNAEKIKVNFDINVSDKIQKGNNTIGVSIRYKDNSEKEYNLEKTIYVLDVKSENEKEDEDDESAATPKIIIASYSTNPKTIVAGNDFDFSFIIKNTSKDKKLRNMKVTVSSTEGAFIITKGSNTFYIEEIGKDESISRSIDLKAKQSLTSNSYPVILDFDYEDFNGNQYRASETINIPVTEYSKLVINSIMAGEGYVGENANLSFDYVNMGKATISNLTASVEGDYEAVQSINYIGNLETGRSDYFDIEVSPKKEGMLQGVLVLSFEDSSGRIIEARKDFEGFSMARPVFDDMPGGMLDYGDIGTIEPMPSEEELATWKIVLSGIGAFIGTFILSKMITTKIVRKKLEDEI